MTDDLHTILNGISNGPKVNAIHCLIRFVEMNLVMFNVALSQYDQVVAHDTRTNALKSSMSFFSLITRHCWFLSTDIILLLTKVDLFRERIRRVPLTTCFPNFQGDPHSYDEGCEYIARQFNMNNRSGTKSAKAGNSTTRMSPYYHFICGIERYSVQYAFEEVHALITAKNLNTNSRFGMTML